MTCRHYTLIEAMAVCSVLLIVLTGAGRLMYDASLANRQFTDHAWSHQQLFLLQRDWQEFIRESDPAAWWIVEDTFLAKGRSAELTDGKLAFELASRTTVRRVPPGCEIQFAIEEGRVAVLNLAWPARLGNRDQAQRVRLVAAAIEVQP